MSGHERQDWRAWHADAQRRIDADYVVQSVDEFTVYASEADAVEGKNPLTQGDAVGHFTPRHRYDEALARAEAAEIALHEELVESVGYLHRARSAEAVIEQVRGLVEKWRQERLEYPMASGSLAFITSRLCGEELEALLPGGDAMTQKKQEDRDQDYADGMADGLADRPPRFDRLALGANRVNDYEAGYIDSGLRKELRKAQSVEARRPDWTKRKMPTIRPEVTP